MNIFFFTKMLIPANQKPELQIYLVNDTKKIMKDINWQFEKNKRWRLQYNYLNINYWYFTKTTAKKAGISKLVNISIVFIK